MEKPLVILNADSKMSAEQKEAVLNAQKSLEEKGINACVAMSDYIGKRPDDRG